MEADQPAAFNVSYHLGRFHRVGRRYGSEPSVCTRRPWRSGNGTWGRTTRKRCAAARRWPTAFYAAGHYPEAMDLFRETLGRRARVLGPEHPDTLRSRGSLGNCYHAMGDYETAAGMHRQTLADRERVLGPDHPSSQASRNNLAKAEQALARKLNMS